MHDSNQPRELSAATVLHANVKKSREPLLQSLLIILQDCQHNRSCVDMNVLQQLSNYFLCLQRLCKAQLHLTFHFPNARKSYRA